MKQIICIVFTFIICIGCYNKVNVTDNYYLMKIGEGTGKALTYNLKNDIGFVTVSPLGVQDYTNDTKYIYLKMGLVYDAKNLNGRQSILLYQYVKNVTITRLSTIF